MRPARISHVDDAELVEFTLADQTPGINTVELELSGQRSGA